MDVNVEVDSGSWSDREYRIYPDPPEPWQIVHDNDDPDIHY